MNTPSSTLRAAIYCRISLDRKEEAGVQRQLHLCTKLAEADEATVVATFTDNNISAFSGETRPEYDRLLEAIQNDEVDIVYCFALDRLTRRTKDTLSLFEICERHSVRIKACRGYSLDPTDPSSRLTIIILGLIAEQESIDRASRVQAAFIDRARTGKPKLGGFRMFGYGDDAVTVIEEERQAILDAAEMVLAGKTLREVIREVFDKRSLTTTRGNRMTPATLRNILLNPRVRGLSTFTLTDPETGFRVARDREVVAKGSWPAIIDEATGEKLDAVLKDPARRTNHVGAAPSRFLAGVLVCTCGDRMYVKSRRRKDGSQRFFYYCKHERDGQHVSIGDEVNDLITRVIAARMAKPDALDVIRQALTPEDSDTSEKMTELFADRNALLARREALEEQVVLGELDASTFARVERKIADQLTTIDSKLEGLSRSVSADSFAVELSEEGVTFVDWWEQASMEDRRRLTKLLMDIHVLPGKQGAKKFDPKRVQIDWKS